MKTQILLIGTVLLAGTALLGSPANAYSIRVDSGDFVTSPTSCSLNTASLAFTPGLTTTPYVCTFGSALADQPTGSGPFESSPTTVYTYGSPDNWSSNVQVVVYSLDGNDGGGNPLDSTSPVQAGDTEFAFNYVSQAGNCLVDPTTLGTPKLTFDGVTYEFTGAGGAGICDTTSTSDFVFSPTGYVGWIDDTGTLQPGAALSPGWVIESTSVTPVPEPASWSCALIGGCLFAGFALSRRRRTNP